MMNKTIRTLLCLMLAVFISISGLSVYADTELEFNWQTGDVNGDHAIGADDALQILKYAVAGFSEDVIGLSVEDGSTVFQNIYDTEKAVIEAAPEKEIPLELLYCPTKLPEGYVFASLYADCDNVTLSFSCRRIHGMKDTPVISGILFEKISSLQECKQMLINHGVHFMTFQLEDGTEVLMRPVFFREIQFIMQKDDIMMGYILCPTIQGIEEAPDVATEKAMLLEYMETQAQEDFLRLLPEFELKRVDPGVVMAGDVNGDSQINAEDALYVLKYSVGKIDCFPVDLK